MPTRNLRRNFSIKMLPLALVSGLVLAVAPPLSYRLVSWQQIRAQGDVYAEQVALRLSNLALTQPLLWHYNISKIAEATHLHQQQKDIEELQVYDCRGELLFGSLRTLSSAPLGTALIGARGRILGRVHVVMSTQSERSHLLQISALSGALGIAMALLLFFFPVSVVSRQARHLELVLGDLELAQDALKQANQDLTLRVTQATAEIRQRSLQVVTAQETERNRIARDLHDGLGQSITGLQLDIEMALRDHGQAPQLLSRARATSSTILKDLRGLVRQLNPPELEGGDLLAAIRALCESFEERTKLPCYVRKQGVSITAEDLPPEIALALYRMTQEALTNIQRHAGAREVTVQLNLGPVVVLEINDDGNGFDPGTSCSGSGLRSMRDRCTLLGGHLDVQSQVGAGTHIIISIPGSGETA